MEPKSSRGYVEAHSTEFVVILAELAESAAIGIRSWALAVSAIDRGDRDRALEELSEAATRLRVHGRIELNDALRILAGAATRLDREG
jgi:hypothetical protein